MLAVCLLSLVPLYAYGIVYGSVASLESIPKREYAFTKDAIDVVIPCSPKDISTLNLCIEGIRTYGQNVRRIIIVSDKQLTDQAEWFDEKKYPFSKYDIALAIFNNDGKRARQCLLKEQSHICWLYQQLLKLYAPFVIPKISPNVLILDSDVVFFKPVSFTNEQGGGLYNATTGFHAAYFDHMKALLPGLIRADHHFSGISHHMLFQRPVLEELFAMIGKHHYMDAWRALCKCIGHRYSFGAVFSEYEIYFNFVFLRTNQVAIRLLKYADVKDIASIDRFKAQGYHYVACHTYLR